MEVNLIRVTKNGKTTSIPLTNDRTLVGRLDSCHIRVPTAGISRKHCEIVVEDGSITMNDLGSSNGTYVNQDRVESQPMSAGDLISFGGLVFVLQVNNEPEQIFSEMMYEDGLPDDTGPETHAQPAVSKPAQVKQSVTSSLDAELDALGESNDDSSMVDFEFDFDDDDDQPPL